MREGKREGGREGERADLGPDIILFLGTKY
jgi:hypothetical protein